MTPLDTLCPAPFHELPDAQRARVLNRLADTELFVALDADPVGDRVRIRLFDLPQGRLAIAADQEDRVAAFFDAPTEHVAMPGRALAAMLAAEDVSLMVNPGAASEMLLEPSVLGWLAEALSQTPAEMQAGPARLAAPSSQMVAALAEPLATRLSDMEDIAETAALVSAKWQDGAEGHLLVLSGVEEGQRALVAKALGELLAFLPPLPESCDVAFDLPLPDAALILRNEKNEAAQVTSGGPTAPGSNPDKPPILRF